MSLFRHTCTYLDIFISMYRFWNHIYLCPWQDKRTRSRLRVNKLNICCQRRIRNISRGFSNLRGAEHPYPPLCAVHYTANCCVNCVCVNFNKKVVLFLFPHCAVSFAGKPSRALHALYLGKLQYLDSRQHLVRSVLAETPSKTHFNRDPDPICKSQIGFS